MSNMIEASEAYTTRYDLKLRSLGSMLNIMAYNGTKYFWRQVYSVVRTIATEL
jgi:hypothetical protein